MRLLWLIFGGSALALGALGAVLPVLPTTPFVLLAAFCFGKSSPRLRNWLVTHRLFGPMIKDWEAHGAIAPRYKRLACIMMGGVFLISLFMGAKPIVLLVQALGMGLGALYVLTRPSAPRHPDQSP